MHNNVSLCKIKVDNLRAVYNILMLLVGGVYGEPLHPVYLNFLFFVFV